MSLISKRTNCRKCSGELIRQNILPKRAKYIVGERNYVAADYTGHEIFVCYTCNKCGATLRTAKNGDTFQG